MTASAADAASSSAAVDALISEASVIVVTGPGGVGKTSVSAAIGARAAAVHDRRVLVVTVDPARRLADALGVNGLAGEAVLVPVGAGDGRLWVKMIEMTVEWERIVDVCAPSPESARLLKSNSLFQSLTSRFVASHDYVALDHLFSVARPERAAETSSPAVDLIVVDTPPGKHALDILDAPGRLDRFLSGRLLRWLTAGQGGRLGAIAARPFVAVAERLLGNAFLTRIVEFFTLFAQLRPKLAERLRVIEGQMNVASTKFVTVAVGEQPVLEAAAGLCGEALARDLLIEMVLVNRSYPTTKLSVAASATSQTTALSLEPGLDSSDLAQVNDGELRQAIEHVCRVGHSFSIDLPGKPTVVALPRRASGIATLDDLDHLLAGGREVT